MDEDCVECGTSPLVKAGNSYYTCALCVKAKRAKAAKQTPRKRVSASLLLDGHQPLKLCPPPSKTT